MFELQGDGQLASMVVSSLNHAVSVVDRGRRILLWNPAAERLTGFGASMVLGRSCREQFLLHADRDGVELRGSRCPLLAALAHGADREAEVLISHREGHRFPVTVQVTPLRNERGEIVGATELLRGDAEAGAIRQKLSDLEAQALTDPLTGLGNRRYLDIELGRWLAGWSRYGQRYGLLMVDLDHFKRVNDRFGHALGDRALRMVANTLAFGSRASDVVGRWGGEEFVVLTRSVDDAGLARVAERLRTLVEACEIDAGPGPPLRVTVSLGAALVRPGDDVGSLLARADAELFRAKAGGRNRVQVAPAPGVDLTAAASR